MTEIILAFTLFCLAVPFYVYMGYPILLFLLNNIFPKRKTLKADITPSVALFVSCYNEQDVIEKKILNCLNLDYPKEKLEYIFISDGSEDETDDIIKRFSTQGIRLVRQEGRLGKTSGLNLAMPETNAEIIVFSDANAIYDEQAIRQLVRSFNDPEVGYVVGAALYTDGEENSAAKSEDTYWQYEMAMKKMETNLHSVVGGDGAIYAIRKSLFDPLDREDINDFVNPLQIIAKGYRGIFEPDAKCFEETAGDFDKEGKRKERIVNRSFRGLMKVKEVMNPLKTGFFSLEVISHKLLRWLVPAFLLVATFGCLYLSFKGMPFFNVMVILGIVFLWLAGIGQMKSKSANIPSIFYYPYYFILVNTRSLLGIIAALKGNIQITWSSPRQKTEANNTLSTKYKLAVAIFTIVSALVMLSSIHSLLFAS